MKWLDALPWPADPGDRVLVLCRSASAETLIRRYIACRGGLLGVEVTTPLGLAVKLDGDATQPDGGPDPIDGD